MRQVRRAAEEIASHRRSGRSAGSVALAPSATASGAGHHEQIDRSRCESNTVDCRRHRQTVNSAEPTSAMSEHGTFGRFQPLARAWPPSGGKISASAALSASACRTRRSARPGSARTRTHRPRITAGVCAFSLTSRITQREGTTGRDAPDNCTLLYPGDPGPAPVGSTARFTGVRPPAGTPACSMIPGWRPPPGPGSPGVRRNPADSPAIPEPGPRARRHPGVPAGLPFTPCAVTLDQLHRQGDGPRAAGKTDGDASAARQSRKTLSAACECARSGSCERFANRVVANNHAANRPR